MGLNARTGAVTAGHLPSVSTQFILDNSLHRRDSSGTNGDSITDNISGIQVHSCSFYGQNGVSVFNTLYVVVVCRDLIGDTLYPPPLPFSFRWRVMNFHPSPLLTAPRITFSLGGFWEKRR